MFSPNELDILAKVYARILSWSDKEDTDYSIPSDDDTGREENSTGTVKDKKVTPLPDPYFVGTFHVSG